MAIRLVIDDSDKYYDHVKDKAIVINDLPADSDNQDVVKLLYTLSTTETIDTAPVCSCGAVKGKYNEGIVCRKCNTKCVSIFDNNDPLIWFRTLSDDLPLISPVFWLMLRSALRKKSRKVKSKRSDFDVLRWLGDHTYNPDAKIPTVFTNIVNVIPNFERNYKYLINNLDNIIKYFTEVLPTKRDKLLDVLKVYYDFKDVIYSRHLPLVNKRVFIVDKIPKKGTFGLLTVGDLINITMDYRRNVSKLHNVTINKSSVLSKLLSNLANIVESIHSDIVAGKKGVSRQNIYTARTPFSMRFVITPLVGPHRINELHVPWAAGLTTYRPYIVNKLLHRGYSPKEITKMINDHIHVYNGVINEIYIELINEANEVDGFIGLPVIMQRNPSMFQGSAQRVFITKFKTDPMDKSISTSIYIAPNMNADHDGDELNFTALLDVKMGKLAATLDPHYSVPSLTEVGGASGLAGLPKGTIATLSNYMARGDEKQTSTGGLTFDYVEV